MVSCYCQNSDSAGPENGAQKKPSQVVDIRSFDRYSLLGMFVGLVTEKGVRALLSQSVFAD